ncbi:MAG: hypothetical protein RL653_1135 [Pseudomonadota bacterium]|jgi:flagellar motor switch protein FliN/FliY
MDNSSPPRRLDLLLDVPLGIKVELGRTQLTVQQVLGLVPGSVLELDKLGGEPMDVLVNDRLIARGEAVVVNDKFGFRIADIVSRSERITRIR